MKNDPCPSTALKMLGDYWTLTIIQSLSDGEKRFRQLERDVPTINPATLTNRLKKLEADNIIQRKKETLDKLSVTYALTQKGRAILPIIAEIGKFADRYAK